MEDKDQWSDISILPRTLGNDDVDERERRELLVMKAGAHLFGVFADEAASVTEASVPTPLPGAPLAVLGVASVRGRMRTVLDPLMLLLNEDDTASDAKSAPQHFVVALRGDEQLALAVERVDRITEVFTETLELITNSRPVLRGVVHLDGGTVNVLDPQHLFEAAMSGTERRRQR